MKFTLLKFTTVLLTTCLVLAGCTTELLPPVTSGNLYVLEDGTKSVLSVTPAGDVSIFISAADIKSLLGNVNDSIDFSNCGIVATTTGEIYFVVDSDNFGYNIIKRANNGDLSILVDNSDITTVTSLADVELMGLIIGVNGMLYTADSESDSLLEINTSTGNVEILVSGSTFDALIAGSSFDMEPGIGADERYIYVSSDGVPDAVYRVSYNGNAEVYTSGPGVDPTDINNEIVSIWITELTKGDSIYMAFSYIDSNNQIELQLPQNATAQELEDAINVPFGDIVEVTGSGTIENPWILDFVNGVDFFYAGGSKQPGGYVDFEIVQQFAHVNVANHIEAIGTNATNGEIEFRFDNNLNIDIPEEEVKWNVGDTAQQVHDAIVAQHDAFESGDVTVTGTGTFNDPWLIEFGGIFEKVRMNIQRNLNDTDGDVNFGTVQTANAFDDNDGYLTRRSSGTLMTQDDSGAHFLYEISRLGIASVFMSEWDIKKALANKGEELDLEGGLAYDDEDNLYMGNNSDSGSPAILKITQEKTITKFVTEQDVNALTKGGDDDVSFEGMAFQRLDGF